MVWPGCPTGFYAFAERVPGDVSDGAGFGSRASGGCTIDELAVLLQGDGYSLSAGEKAGPLRQ